MFPSGKFTNWLVPCFVYIIWWKTNTHIWSSNVQLRFPTSPLVPTQLLIRSKQFLNQIIFHLLRVHIRYEWVIWLFVQLNRKCWLVLVHLLNSQKVRNYIEWNKVLKFCPLCNFPSVNRSSNFKSVLQNKYGNFMDKQSLIINNYN